MRADLADVEARIAASSPTGAAGEYLAFDTFTDWGVHAIVTTRGAGSFATAGDAPVGDVLERWGALQRFAAGGETGRFATARQVHGAELIAHTDGWRGWLRGPAADGHVAPTRGTTLAVTVADCVPVYLAHPSGATALLHAGWRGTVAGIVPAAIRHLASLGHAPGELRLLTGPAICGACYEVSPDVFGQLTGRSVDRPTTVALDGVIARQARAAGVGECWAADRCTRCDNDRFYSHRAGDPGRQVGVVWGG
ncbi:MAG TPA: polyphenol oxidase family protein [Gemmatirosa sp.]